MSDYIKRQEVKELFQEACEMKMYDFLGIDDLPSVSTEANKEDIHREREQAYMRGYEDACKKYRIISTEKTGRWKKILNAVKYALELNIQESRIVDILMHDVEDEIETVLYDDREEVEENGNN